MSELIEGVHYVTGVTTPNKYTDFTQNEIVTERMTFEGYRWSGMKQGIEKWLFDSGMNFNIQRSTSFLSETLLVKITGNKSLINRFKNVMITEINRVNSI